MFSIDNTIKEKRYSFGSKTATSKIRLCKNKNQDMNRVNKLIDDLATFFSWIGRIIDLKLIGFS